MDSSITSRQLFLAEEIERRGFKVVFGGEGQMKYLLLMVMLKDSVKRTCLHGSKELIY